MENKPNQFGSQTSVDHHQDQRETPPAAIYSSSSSASNKLHSMMSNIYLNLAENEHTTTMLLPKEVANRHPSDDTAIDCRNHLNDNNMIPSTSCPPTDIFCDSVSAIAEMLSFDCEEDAVDELPSVNTHAIAVVGAVGGASKSIRCNGNQTTSPRSVLEQQRRASYHAPVHAPLTPSAYSGIEGGGRCQRRGRFLIWPASLSSPSLGIPNTQSA